MREFFNIFKRPAAFVDKFDHVEILNLQLSSGNCSRSCLSQYARGSIEKGGILFQLGFLDDSTYIVQYMTPNNRTSFGAPLPSGAIFYIRKDKFDELLKKTNRQDIEKMFEEITKKHKESSSC